MPLIHIYMNEGKTVGHIKRICDGIHEALLQAWDIPETDRFHIIREKNAY